MTTSEADGPAWPRILAAGASGGALMLWEVLITRVFSVVLFADLAHLALAVAMLGVTVGAAAVALLPAPADLHRRMGRLLLAQGLASVAVTALALLLPLTDESSALLSWYERDRVRFDLLAVHWFGLLVALLPAPAVASGALVATVFLRPAVVARAYAADLGAAAGAALLFVPLSRLVAPPDLSLLAALVCFLTAAALRPTRAPGALLSGLAAVALALAAARPVLPLRHAAGWAEVHVVTARWTPTARLAIFSGPAERGLDGDYLLLDNGSASLIATKPAQLKELTMFVSRGLVHALSAAPGRVAVLAAGAGPEVAVALQQGHREILAIDLDAEMFEMVRAHVPEPDRNPLLAPEVRVVAMDARAALQREGEPFDIIQLVHPNLTTATGLLNSAWSPRLLYTREAIGIYLDHLSAEGTLSITAPELLELRETVRSALAERGVAEPDTHIVAVATARRDQVLLVKPRPFTALEEERIGAWLDDHRLRRQELPGQAATVFTDDRPYADRLSDLLPGGGGSGGALAYVYRTMLWSLGVLLAVLLGLSALALRRWPSGLRIDRPALAPLMLAVCLGYGYLAVEVVFIHRLVPLVGHPVYALTVALVAMLAGSGAGSALAGRLPTARLPLVLAAVPVAGLLTAAMLPPLGSAVLPLTLPARAALVGTVLLPLAAVMGMAMPLALRAVGEARPSLGALMWALNGWASVLAATLAVMIARFAGYPVSLAVALALYALGAVIVWRMPGALRVGR